MRGHGIFWAQLSHWVLGESGGGGVGKLDRKDKLGPDCRGHSVKDFENNCLQFRRKTPVAVWKLDSGREILEAGRLPSQRLV